MHYFIDGYNLMFRRLRAGNDLQTQRRYLISELDEKTHLLQLDVTIVFDAQYQYGEGSRSHLHQLEICFTDEGETADEYILDRLRMVSDPRQETVVTSDRKFASQVRLRFAHTETVEKFMSWLNKRCHNTIRHQREQRVQREELSESKPYIESETMRWLRLFEQRFEQLEKHEDEDEQRF